MKRVWNVHTRVYDMVQEGVLLHGTDITTAADFVRIWQEVHGNEQVSARHLQTIFGKLCERVPLPVYALENDLKRDIKHELAKIYVGYAYQFQGRKGTGGRDTHIKYTAVPQGYRLGLQAVISGDPTPYHRGAHNSNPSVNSGAQAKNEYHLTTTQDGRVTTARFSGSPLVACYYSLGHAAATYSYHLVTYTYRDEVSDEDWELPLLGGTVDGLLDQRPY